MKRSLALILSLLLCLSLLPGEALAAGEHYDDVPRWHWAYDSIKTVTESGLMQGYGDRRFGPADQLTVAQVARILCNARGDETAAANGFWAYGAIERCRDELKCLPDRGTITAENYDVPISRELAVYMLVNGMELQPGADASEITLADLPDGDGIAAEYRDAVLAAYRIGLVLGTDTAGTFNPKGLLTRAEGAALFARATDLAAAKKPYLTFRSDEPFTLSTKNGLKNWDGVLEYSTDTKIWNEWDGTEIKSGESNPVLYLRGTDNTVITGRPPRGVHGDDMEAVDRLLYGKGWALSGNSVSCFGNIENLLDYRTVADGRHPVMADYCYYSLFYDCKSLAKAPELQAMRLTDYCYYDMFVFCTSLTSAPVLPATTLARGCYCQMFSYCMSLTSAPVLPATTLAENCYEGMFTHCESLSSAPVLSAMTLAEGCYYCMFWHCSSLTVAPELPAIKLADSCYAGMFHECSSLIAAPLLPATALADACYADMFGQCTSLDYAPALPATALTSACYANMFWGCTALTSIPELPATALVQSCYYHMFENCTGIKLSETQTGEYTIPYQISSTGDDAVQTTALADMFAATGGTFTGTPEINTTYYLHSSNSIVG